MKFALARRKNYEKLEDETLFGWSAVRQTRNGNTIEIFELKRREKYHHVFWDNHFSESPSLSPPAASPAIRQYPRKIYYEFFLRFKMLNFRSRMNLSVVSCIRFFLISSPSGGPRPSQYTQRFASREMSKIFSIYKNFIIFFLIFAEMGLIAGLMCKFWKRNISKL